MLLLNCILVLFYVADWTQAHSEFVWLEDLNNDHDLRHLDLGLPNRLDFNLKRHNGNQLKLQLRENTRLNANAPMYEAVKEDGKQRARKLNVPQIMGTKFYQDKRIGAAVKSTCKVSMLGACQRVLEGSLHIDGESYEIKPLSAMPVARGMRSQKEVPHVITRVEQPSKSSLREADGSDVPSHDSKPIPSNYDEVDEREAPTHDSKPIPSNNGEKEGRSYTKPMSGTGEKQGRSYTKPMSGEKKNRSYKKAVSGTGEAGESDVPIHYSIPPKKEEDSQANQQDDIEHELSSLFREELQEEIKKMLSERKRLKRGDNKKYAVEVVVVIDPAMWNKYSTITNSTDETATEYVIKERMAHVMNGVSLRYEAIDDLDVYVTISEFLIYKTKDTDNPLSPTVEIPVIDGIEYADAYVYLDGLPKWAEDAPITKHNDHIMVMTGYELYYGGNTNNSGVAGVAYVGGACGDYRTSVQEDTDYFALTSVIAHEIGHNLNASHDGGNTTTDCPDSDEFIMAPSVASFSEGEVYSLNPWRFSTCSIEAFKTFFDSVSCFDDHGDYYDSAEWADHNTQKPGERYSAKEQCKLIKGDDSYWCESATDDLEDICRFMVCYDKEAGYCNSAYAAARGTPCGDSKWCIDGQCVQKSEDEEDGDDGTNKTTETKTTQVPEVTNSKTTETKTTQVPEVTTTDSCVDSTWYGLTCAETDDYILENYEVNPSIWCQNSELAVTCCAYCKGISKTTETKTTQVPKVTNTKTTETKTTQVPEVTNTKTTETKTTQVPEVTNTKTTETKTTQVPKVTNTKTTETKTTQVPKVTNTKTTETKTTQVPKVTNTKTTETKTTQVPKVTNTKTTETKTTQVPKVTNTKTTETKTTQVPKVTTNDSCVDSTWYGLTCAETDDYILENYEVNPSIWCQNSELAVTCCAYCKGISKTTETKTTQVPEVTTIKTTEIKTTQVPEVTTDSCVDSTWYGLTCAETNDYILENYGDNPSIWCQNSELAVTCCAYCKDKASKRNFHDD